MRSRIFHRKVSLRGKIFQYSLLTTFFSLLLLASFWIISEVKNFKKEIQIVKNTFSETKKLEIKNKILEIKDWIHWIQRHPPESIVKKINSQTTDFVKSSEYSTRLLQDYCLDTLSRVRFAEDEYVFINTSEGKALISNGKINRPPIDILMSGDTSWINIFKKEQLANSKSGGYFYTYPFRKISENKTAEKTSFFGYLPEWDWIIGTGYYEDDFNLIIDSKRKVLFRKLQENLLNFVPFFLFSILLSYLIFSFFSKRLSKNFNLFKDFFRQAIREHNLINNSLVSYYEFEVLADTANQMIVESLKDIANRQKAEEKILHREQQLSLIYSNVFDAIYYLSIEADNRFRFLTVNKTFLELTGLPENQIVNKYVDEIIPEPSLSMVIGNYLKAIHDRVTIHWEEITEYPTGKKTGLVSITPLFDSGNKCTNLVGTVHDITERKRAEEEIKLHRDHLEELVIQRTAELEIEKEHAQSADRLKSAFLATMSHELRTPLNSIIGFTGILMQERPGPLNDEQKKQLGMAQSSARHLLSLINDVLDISKIEAGQLKMNIHQFDLPELIHKVVETNRPVAEKKNLRITVTIDEKISNITSDNLRVQQILINIINNAIKFTETGTISIHCFSAGSFVKIQVSDTGIGIANEKIEQLFQPFMQIDTGLARKHEGTGLGLSICKKLTEMLDGKIEVESKYGLGSTFTVTLPTIKT